MPLLEPRISRVEKRKPADVISQDSSLRRKKRAFRSSDGIVNIDTINAPDVKRESDWEAAKMDQYPPGEEERDWYFKGLMGSPVLVARTSSSPWLLQQTRGRPYKPYRPIADHHILFKWSQSIEQRILKTLGGCDWRFFWPIRIYDGQHESSNVVLLIGVDGISLQWSLAIQKALVSPYSLRGRYYRR